MIFNRAKKVPIINLSDLVTEVIQEGELDTESVEEDLINDPSHYRQGGIAVHEVLDAYGLDRKHYLASATEYILRSGFKSTEESDLRKAVWHLNHYIEQHFGGDDED